MDTPKSPEQIKLQKQTLRAMLAFFAFFAVVPALGFIFSDTALEEGAEAIPGILFMIFIIWFGLTMKKRTRNIGDIIRQIKDQAGEQKIEQEGSERPAIWSEPDRPSKPADNQSMNRPTKPGDSI